jgi:hypothetical protein
MLLCSAFIKLRCVQTWASCYSSLDNSIPVVPFYMINHSALSSTPTTTQLSQIDWFDSISSPLSSLEDDYDLDFNSGPNDSSSAEMYTIRTKFNPSLERNTKVEYKTKDDKKLYNFTEKERGFAALATNCETLEDLDTKVVYILVYIFYYSFFLAHQATEVWKENQGTLPQYHTRNITRVFSDLLIAYNVST